MDKVPDDLSQNPFRGADMSEKMLTKGDDIDPTQYFNIEYSFIYKYINL